MKTFEELTKEIRNGCCRVRLSEGIYKSFIIGDIDKKAELEQNKDWR